MRERKRRDTPPLPLEPAPTTAQKAFYRKQQLLLEERVGKFQRLSFNFEDGVREIVERVKQISDTQTILIGVYGNMNSGKSHLIDRLKKELGLLGMYTAGMGGGPSTSCFEQIKGYGQWSSGKCAYVFHCAWPRGEGHHYEKVFGHEDPNILADKILGRKLDLNIFIYRRDIREIGSDGDYDLVISNPEAKIKPPPRG